MTRIFAALAVFAVSCTGTERWTQRESFYREARCGMAVDSAGALAERLGGSEWICRALSARLTECNFEVGRTRVSMDFEDGKLQSLEDGDYFGITGFASRPKVNVCTGARSRSVIITPPDAGWIGAVISVDGQSIGTITAGHAQSVDVPLGRHVLQAEKPDRAVIKREITVPDGTLREPPEVKLR
jgi:hypothetical protein